MGVLRIDDERTWGSSKSLLHELLFSVMDNSQNERLKASIEIAIKQNIAVYSLVDASQAEIDEFRQAVDRLSAYWSRETQDRNTNILSALELLKELKGMLQA